MQRKFTLIELLVVVAIIAILSSMLMPSLAKSRESAKRAVCLSRQSQIGKLLAMFQDDNEGRFPPYVNAGSNSGHTWIGKKGESGGLYSVLVSRPLNSYIGVTENTTSVPIAECPSDKRDDYDQKGSSFYSNKSNLRDPAAQSKSIRVEEVVRPTVFIVGGPRGGLSSISSRTSSRQETNYTHSRLGDFRWNFLYADGHTVYTRITPRLTTSEKYTKLND